jgi:outer membrane receptor protein involved in Fe transport
LTYVNPRIATISTQMQFVSLQYDDDANARGVFANGCTPGAAVCATPGLPGYAVMDINASRAFTRNVEAFFGVQNLFDKEYYVGTNPTLVGSPRMVIGGVRLRFSSR